MTIFDAGERTADGPASHLVGRFDYLNSSARTEAARVRELLERFLLHYPAALRDALAGRIRSRDERSHTSAVFELVLHELLLVQGFQVVAVEPEMGNGRAPDFLVEAPDGTRFYLEATIAWGALAADAGADQRLREVLQAIDDVHSPDFFLSLHHRGVPQRQVSIRALRREVQAFVDGLDYDAIRSELENNRQAPVFETDAEGMRIAIEVVPKHHRGTDGRAIGGRMLAGGQINAREAILAALRRKAGRYGQLDLPYIIAVNAIETFADGDSVTDALFGTEAVQVGPNGHRFVRNPDGLWQGGAGPTNTRVSGVLSVSRLSAWDIGQRTLTLTLNPWAANPLSTLSLGGHFKSVQNDSLVSTEGSSLGQVFGLPEGWPE